MRPAPAGLCAGGRAAWARLAGPVAHRGLWGSPDVPENTLAAFTRAAEAGYGVELDVRLSVDGVPMVFHDADLDRLTDATGPLAARTAHELGGIVVGGREPIPTLAAALDAVGAGTLILVELKTGEDADRLVKAVLVRMPDDNRPLAIISFSADAHRVVERERPDLLRGVHLTTEASQVAEAQAADAHFLLPSLDALESRDAVQVAWTARSPGAYAAAAQVADGVIFEGFRPEPRAWR